MIMHRNPFGSAKTFLQRCYYWFHHMHKLKRIEIYPAIYLCFEKSKKKQQIGRQRHRLDWLQLCLVRKLDFT